MGLTNNANEHEHEHEHEHNNTSEAAVSRNKNGANEVVGTDASWLEDDPLDGEPLFRLSLNKFVAVFIYIGVIFMWLLLCNLEKTAATSSKWLGYVVGAFFLFRLLGSIFVYRGSKALIPKWDFTSKVKQYFISAFRNGSNQASSRESHMGFEPLPSVHTTTPIYYLANIKIGITILIVAAHSSFSIGGFIMGGYKNSLSITLSFLLFVYGPIAMPLFFFISAYFVPDSLARKKRRVFLNDKSIRLTTVLAFGYFVTEPSWLLLAQRKFYPEAWQTLFKYGFRYGELWFLFWNLIFIYAYVSVSDSWPCHSASHKVDFQPVKGTDDEEIESTSRADNENEDRDTQESSSELRSKRPPLIKLMIFGAISGIFEGVRQNVASAIPPLQGNFFWYVLFFIGGLIARRDGWLEGANILMPKERLVLAAYSAIVILILLVILLIDLHNDATIIVPFSNKCGDVTVGNPNPTFRFDKRQLKSIGFLYDILLYMGLGIYSVTASLYILDISKRKLDYTNRLLQFLGNSAYGVYVLHFVPVIGYTCIWISILQKQGTVEELQFSAIGVSYTCLGPHGFLWLGFLFIFSITILTVFPAVHLIKKLPIVRNIL